MRRRLALLLVLVMLGAGCQWTQGWHWPRQPADAETVVYFWDATDPAEDQSHYVWWAAQVWDYAANIRVVYTTRCPDLTNCVYWFTESNGGGRAQISVGGNRHIVNATAWLDYGVSDFDDPFSYWQDLNIACHEAGHALGGGFDDASTPWDEHQGLCEGGWPTPTNYNAIAAAYAPHAEGGSGGITITHEAR
jgi:hypothetical protein